MSEYCRCKLWELDGYEADFMERRVVRIRYTNLGSPMSKDREILWEDVIDETEDEEESCRDCTVCGYTLTHARQQFLLDYAGILRAGRVAVVPLLFDTSYNTRKVAKYLLRYSPYCRGTE